MKLTLQTQLLPDAEQVKALKETVERFNEAANWLAGVAFDRKVSNKFVLQRIAYAELRERFGLPADTAIRCIFLPTLGALQPGKRLFVLQGPAPHYDALPPASPTR